MKFCFPIQLTLACAILFFAIAASAQNAPPPSAPPPAAAAPPPASNMDGVSAGGKWIEFSSEDKMTGAKKVRFELEGDTFLRGAEARPKVIVFCVGGKLKLGDFRPNVRIAPPNRASFIGRPQLKVRVRVENDHYSHNWNWVRGDFLAMDEDTVRKLIGSSIFKIEFTTPNGPQIAEFSPAGLDLARVREDCKLKPEKP